MGVRRHRRYSTEFKLRLGEAYLAGEGSARGLAIQHRVSHSLLRIWVDKYRKGELTLDVQREEQIREYQQRIAALERKVGDSDPAVSGSSPPVPTTAGVHHAVQAGAEWDRGALLP